MDERKSSIQKLTLVGILNRQKSMIPGREVVMKLKPNEQLEARYIGPEIGSAFRCNL